MFPFNLSRYSFTDLDPTETGSYPEPMTDQQVQWTPEDGYPLGDEPLTLPEGENPLLEESLLPFRPDGGPGVTEEEPS